MPGRGPTGSGDLVPDSAGGAITWTVAAADQPKLLVYATARRLWSQRNVNPAGPAKPTRYRASWAFILRPEGTGCTRLIVRWRHQLIPPPGQQPAIALNPGATQASSIPTG